MSVTTLEPRISSVPPADKPRLLFFYSKTSGDSRRADGYLSQVLQRRQSFKAFNVIRVDIASLPELVKKLEVTEVPTLLVVEGGRVTGRLAGRHSVSAMQDFLQPWVDQLPQGN